MRVIRLDDGDHLVSVAKLVDTEDNGDDDAEQLPAPEASDEAPATDGGESADGSDD